MSSIRPEAGASLILGTVQFGMAYGVAGRGGAVPAAEVREILELAAAHSVHTLDTAPVYGDIEARLADLCDGLSLAVISKIPPLPESGTEGAVGAAVERSRGRLGKRLSTLLFHRAEDLLRPDADSIWRAATDAAGPIRMGVSCYDPATAVRLRERYEVKVAQMPANPLDQRLLDAGMEEGLAGVEVHARSVFLQGLLLMPEPDVRAKVPAALEAHRRWTSWCRDHGVDPVAAALAVTRALPGVRHCVVGVDRASQLREILESVSAFEPVDSEHLRCDEPDVIDPRRWPAVS